MSSTEIDLRRTKQAVNAVLDHLIEDLGIEKVAIDKEEDFYWECPPAQPFDSSKKPAELDIGRLSDDLDFMKLVRRGQSFDVAFNLVHIVPLLRYVALKVRK